MIFTEAFILFSAGLALAGPLRVRDTEGTYSVGPPVMAHGTPPDVPDAPPSQVKAAAGGAAPPGSEPTGWLRPGSDDFIEVCLYHHNVHRANHSAPPVRWDDQLFDWAQAKANKCVYNDAAGPNWDDVGINIAGGTYGSPKKLPNPSTMITALWYNNELENFPKYGDPNPPYKNFEDWGHFTQVVWPDSRRIGCGLADCGNRWFGLCLYGPPGNWEGEFNIIGRPKGYPTVYPNGRNDRH